MQKGEGSEWGNGGMSPTGFDVLAGIGVLTKWRRHVIVVVLRKRYYAEMMVIGL